MCFRKSKRHWLDWMWEVFQLGSCSLSGFSKQTQFWVCLLLLHTPWSIQSVRYPNVCVCIECIMWSFNRILNVTRFNRNSVLTLFYIISLYTNHEVSDDFVVRYYMCYVLCSTKLKFFLDNCYHIHQKYVCWSQLCTNQ